MQFKFIEIFKVIKICWEDHLNELVDATGIRALKLFIGKKLHPLEKFAGILILALAIFSANKIAGIQIKRYNASPVVISLDRNYKTWNGTFPAITICYYDSMDLNKANQYLQNQWNISTTDEEYFYFIEFLFSIINATVDDFKSLANFANDDRFKNLDLHQVAKHIFRSADYRIESFYMNQEINIQSVFTEKGICYTLNSPLSDIMHERNFKINKTHRNQIQCNYSQESCYIQIQMLSSGAKLEMHSPYEIPESKTDIIYLQEPSEIQAFYKAAETIGSEQLRDVSISQRRCAFPDEKIFDLPIYTPLLCAAKCRALMAVEICNCVPFFYPYIDGLSCNPKGFECLLDVQWPLWDSHLCNCPVACTIQTFSIQSIKRKIWKKESDTTLKRSSTIKWKIVPPKVRFQRNIFFSYEDLIVSFGGVAVLFLGISLWNACNILAVIGKSFIITNFRVYKLIFHKSN